MGFAEDGGTEEALLRYPATGGWDGKPCICTRECPAACDGVKCGGKDTRADDAFQESNGKASA